jgi:hypothetical protein
MTLCSWPPSLLCSVWAGYGMAHLCKLTSKEQISQSLQEGLQRWNARLLEPVPLGWHQKEPHLGCRALGTGLKWQAAM